MKNKHRARIVFVGVLVLFLAATTGAQFKKLRKPKIKIPKLSTIFKQKPAITTSLNDALLEIPFLDEYIPPVPLPMGSMETSDEDMFMLFPGAYFFNAQSYCLHAGTYSPSKGDGYVYESGGGLGCFMVRLGRNGHPLPTAECLKQKIKEGKVPEGSLESPRTLMFGSIQHAGNQTRVTVREVDLETGVILRAGKGDTQGTDEGAVQHAAETAVGKMTGNRI